MFQWPLGEGLRKTLSATVRWSFMSSALKTLLMPPRANLCQDAIPRVRENHPMLSTGVLDKFVWVVPYLYRILAHASLRNQITEEQSQAR